MSSLQHETFAGNLSKVRALPPHKKQLSGVPNVGVTLGNPVLSLEMMLRMMAFTYLPGFVTLVFRGMPTVWNMHLIVSWMAQDLVATLPSPTNGVLYLFGWCAMGLSGMR